MSENEKFAVSELTFFLCKIGCVQKLSQDKSFDSKDFTCVFFVGDCGNLAIKSSQTVNIANISTSALNEYKTPFPPLPEQRRIVERIESLFSKLDAAKEKIQNALDGCELRKAAILKKAFNGELTEQWRKEQNEDKTVWRNCWSRFNFCRSLRQANGGHGFNDAYHNKRTTCYWKFFRSSRPPYHPSSA